LKRGENPVKICAFYRLNNHTLVITYF